MLLARNASQAKGEGIPAVQAQEALPNHTAALRLVSQFLSDTFSPVGGCWVLSGGGGAGVKGVAGLRGKEARSGCRIGPGDAGSPASTSDPLLLLPPLPLPLQRFTREVRGVGHRVVHGREISQPVLITCVHTLSACQSILRPASLLRRLLLVT